MTWQNDYRDAYEEAKAANESRYDSILSGYSDRVRNFDSESGQILADYGDRYQRNMGYLEGVGRSQYQDINDSYGMAANKAMRGTIAHGIGNSTVAQSMQQGVLNDKERAKMQLSDSLAREHVDWDSKLSGDELGYKDSRLRGQMGLSKEKLDFMERRTDAYPDINLYAAMAARGGPGMGGTGVGTVIGGGRPVGGSIAETPSPSLAGFINPQNLPQYNPILQQGAGLDPRGVDSINAMGQNAFNAAQANARANNARAMALGGNDFIRPRMEGGTAITEWPTPPYGGGYSQPFEPVPQSSYYHDPLGDGDAYSFTPAPQYSPGAGGGGSWDDYDY